MSCCVDPRAATFRIHPPTAVGPSTTKDFDKERERAPVGDHTTVPKELHAQQKQTLWLVDLPNELLSHVFSFLDRRHPSGFKFNEQPSHSLTESTHVDLKNISRVAKRFRSLVLPALFAHARLDPYKLTNFLSFISKKNLTYFVKSIVAILQGPCNHLYPAWWARLLNSIPFETFTIICAPHVFGELASISITSVDTWAFNMPYHIIRFRQTPDAAREQILLNGLPNILTARPWTEFSANEGSFLKAYTTYEYFLRRTPSLMEVLHRSKSVEAEAMFAKLKAFSFTAIFPFYNHVDEILKSVRKMKKLQCLTVKLCPEPESTVLNDEIEAAGGHIDVNDPWNEFDTSYTLVAHTVISLTVAGDLQEFRVDDVKMEGIRDNIETALIARLQDLWKYEGDGLWTRKPRVTEGDARVPPVPPVLLAHDNL